MSDKPSRPVSTLPAWRTGWTWTLLKCGATTLALVLAATGALYAALRALLEKLPEWLPERLTRWLFEWALQHLWFVGPALGLALGVLASVGVVLFDAKRGRLSKLP